MPHKKYIIHPIDSLRRMTIQYPQMRVKNPFTRVGHEIVEGLTMSAPFAHITDEDARTVNVPRWNREARNYYLDHGASYVDIEYAIESAIVTVVLEDDISHG